MLSLEQLCSLPFLLVCSGALGTTIEKGAQLYVWWRVGSHKPESQD